MTKRTVHTQLAHKILMTLMNPDKDIRLFFRSRPGLLPAMISVILALLLWLCPGIDHLFHRLQFICLDSWTRMNARDGNTNVILVEIDETSIEHIGPWPWSRETYAALIDHIANSNAKVAAIDILMAKESPSDTTLANSMHHMDTILAVYTPDSGGYGVEGYGLMVDKIKLPSRVLAQAATALGHVALVYDPDGVVRKVPAFIYNRKNNFPAFGVATAALWSGNSLRASVISPGHLRIGSIDIPLDSHGFFYIGYRGGPGCFPHVSAIDILEGRVPPGVFKDKVVIIGVTATGLSDEWTTPFAAQGGMTGLEVMANVVQSIIDSTVPSDLSPTTGVMAVIMLGILAGMVGQTLSMRWLPPLVITGPFFIWAAGAAGLILFKTVMPVPPMAASWSMAILGTMAIRALHYRHELRSQAERIRKISRASATLCPESLCAVLGEIVNAQAVVGIFRDKSEGYSVYTAGTVSDSTLSEIYQLCRTEPSQLENRVKNWAKNKQGTCLVLPVESGSSIHGIYLVHCRDGKYLTDDTIEQARDFAAQSALLLEHKMLLEQLKENCQGTLEIIMSTLEKKAPGLLHHSKQVAELAKAIGLHMGLDKHRAELLHKAGMLHDLGLVGVPDAIITKKAGLTPEERVWVESHPGIGAEMVSQVPHLKPCARIIRQHHERYDGKGYPDGLAAGEICIEARILAVAEALVSIMTTRFEQEHDPDPETIKAEALAELRRSAGTQFDMKVVQAVLNMEDEIGWRE